MAISDRNSGISRHRGGSLRRSFENGIGQDDYGWSDFFSDLIFSFQFKVSGIDLVINRKIINKVCYPREILMLRLWDIEMFGFTYQDHGIGNSRTYGFSFLGILFEIESNAVRKTKAVVDKKMIPVLLTILWFVSMYFWAASLVPSAIVSMVPIWGPVSWSQLSLTASLLSYRAFVAGLEVTTFLTNLVRVVTARIDNKDGWSGYLKNVLNYRFWLYMLIAPAVVFHSQPLVFVCIVTALITIADAIFSEESVITFDWAIIGLSFVLCGFTRAVEIEHLIQFSWISFDIRAFTPRKYDRGNLAAGKRAAQLGNQLNNYKKHMQVLGMECRRRYAIPNHSQL